MWRAQSRGLVVVVVVVAASPCLGAFLPLHMGMCSCPSRLAASSSSSPLPSPRLASPLPAPALLIALSLSQPQPPNPTYTSCSLRYLVHPPLALPEACCRHHRHLSPSGPVFPLNPKCKKKKKLKKFWPVAFPSDPEFNCQVPGHCARCDWLACSARLLAARLLLPHIPRPVYVHVHATTCPPSIPALQALPSSPVGITVQHGMQLCNLTRWIQMARAGPLSLLRRYYFNTLYSWLVLSPPTITIHTRYRDFFPKQKKMAGGSLGLSVNPQRLR